MDKKTIRDKINLLKNNPFLRKTEDLFCSSIIHPLFIISIIAGILLLLSFKTYITNSEGFYNYIAYMWNDKIISPYSQISTDKSPGILFVHYISYLLFGFNIWFTRLLAIGANISTSIIIYFIGCKTYNKTAGLFAMALTGLPLTWISISHGFDAQPDSFMIFFTSYAFLTAILSKKIAHTGSKYFCLLVTGCLIGCALMFKQTAMFSLIGLLSYYLLKNDDTLKKKIGHLLFILTGLLLAVIAFLIPLFMSGTTMNLYFCNVWLSLLDHPTTTIYTKIDLLLNAWRYSEIVFFYPLIFVFIIFRKKLIALSIPFWSVLIWFMCDFAGVSASTFLWKTNYKQLLPCLSVVCGISISVIIENFFKDKQDRKKLLLRLIIIIFILGIPLRTIFSYTSSKSAQHIKRKNISFAKWISLNVSKKDRIYLFGEEASLIYLLAKITNPYNHLSDVTTQLKYSQQQSLTIELTENLPKFIAISENSKQTDWLVNILKGPYKLFGNKDVFQEKYGFKIYEKINNKYRQQKKY